MNLGWAEISLVVGVALLIFGPARLPELGKSFAESIKEFRNGLKNSVDDGPSD